MVLGLPVAGLALLLAMIDAEALAALGAINDAREQPAAIGAQRHRTLFGEFAPALPDDLDCLVEVVIIHNAQRFDGFR